MDISDRRRGFGPRVCMVVVLVAALAACSSSGTTANGSSPSSPSSTAGAAEATTEPASLTTTTVAPSTTSPASTTTTAEAPTTSSAPTTSETPPAAAAIKLPSSVRIVSMSWPSMSDGWLLADRGDGTRTLLSTNDAGATWDSSAADDALQVRFADTTNGWIVDGDGVRSTHDGGSSWTAVDLPGGIASGAAVTASGSTVHVAYVGGDGQGVEVATSPIDHDAFAATELDIATGGGPRLDVSMSAGGPFGELVYNDRVLTGAAEIRDGHWTPWDLDCPFGAAIAAAGLSPHGDDLAIACGPSGFGDNAPLVAADLSSGDLHWSTVEPAADADDGIAMLRFATATDAGVRIVAFEQADGAGEIASSTDGGATWPSRYELASGMSATTFAHLADGSVLVATEPAGGVISADGQHWSPVETTPI